MSHSSKSAHLRWESSGDIWLFRYPLSKFVRPALVLWSTHSPTQKCISSCAGVNARAYVGSKAFSVLDIHGVSNVYPKGLSVIFSVSSNQRNRKRTPAPCSCRAACSVSTVVSHQLSIIAWDALCGSRRPCIVFYAGYHLWSSQPRSVHTPMHVHTHTYLPWLRGLAKVIFFLSLVWSTGNLLIVYNTVMVICWQTHRDAQGAINLNQ